MPDQVQGGLAAQQNRQRALPSRFSMDPRKVANIRANNFVSDQQLSLWVRRLAARVPNEAARARFAHVAYGILHADARNARLLGAEEINDAPDWALTKLARGEVLHVFIPHPDAIAPLRETARDLRETALEFSYLQNAPRSALSPFDIVMWQETGKFLTKISKMSFEVIAVKSARFSTARKARLDLVPDNHNPFTPEEIYTSPGRSWRRVRSVDELAKLGDELENCLAAGSRQHAGFAKRFRADTARFWALRDHAGAALMAAMVDSISGRILDVRGFRNAHVKRGDPDLAMLMRARQLRLSPSVYLTPPVDEAD